MEYAKHRPEPIQPGNPHELTRNQHVLPRASIRRFYNEKSKVAAILLRNGRRIKNIDADHNLFWAERVWDQRAEAGYMAQIEREFQFFADRVLREDMRWWYWEHNTITLFYALWEQRARYARNPVPAVEMQGALAGKKLSTDEKERLEANFYLFTDDENRFPSRQLTGIHVQRAIDYRHLELKNVRWSVCKAGRGAGEFLVPDRPGALYVPLSPTVALVGNSDIEVADAHTVRFFNLTAVAGSERFVFARDFSQCFLV